MAKNTDLELEKLRKRGDRAQILLMVLMLVLLVGLYNVVWTNFHETGVWNLFAILAILLVALIPVVTGFWQSQSKIEQAYIDKLHELLLQHHLRTASPDDEVRRIARILTLSVFEQLGTFSRSAKARLLIFLYRSRLIDKHRPVISMAGVEVYNASCAGVDLTGADLQAVLLYNAKLQSAILREACLKGAQLDGANLMWANLENADLRGASLKDCNLQQTVLRGADLTGAIVEEKDLQAAYLDRTTMPDGTVHAP